MGQRSANANTGMTFQRAITRHESAAVAPVVPRGTTDDMWGIFRNLRDAAPALGLKPPALQTLSALLSCLKPGKGMVCFASNRELQRRLGGISDKTIRRHIIELGKVDVLRRQDSPNGKRYPTRDHEGDVEAYGIDLSPMMKNAATWAHAAEHIEIEAVRLRHMRTKLMARLAWLDAACDARHNKINTSAMRTILRRVTLTAADVAVMLTEVEDALALKASDTLRHCASATEASIHASTDPVSGCGGQNVRRLSMSETEDRDKDSANPENDEEQGERRLLRKLASACPSALDFALELPKSMQCVERLAYTLAPFIGINGALIGAAQNRLGTRKAAIAILIMVQLQPRIRNMEAYFTSLITGHRSAEFNPEQLVDRMAMDRMTA